MILLPEQLQELLKIIDTNQAIIIGNQFGLEFLSEYDKSLLLANGVDINTLYSESNDSISTSFHLGMLAQALKDTKALNKLTYKDLKSYIKQGSYIPLSEREKLTIYSIKNQSLSDIRSLNGRIFQDVNGILNNRTSQEEFIREELKEGIEKKKPLREIANDLHRKTGDWSRDFDRIVEYQCNTAYQQGRASFLEQTEGPDVEVYKRVFASACKHCLSLYTTAGFLSEPRIFKLSELKANGSNIGRKTAEWKATVDSTHPFCRCLLFQKRKGFGWNKETQAFDIPIQSERPQLKTPRKGIRMKFNGQEFIV